MTVCSTTEDPLVKRFEAATVDPERFDHRAHMEVAWAYLEGLPLLSAINRMSAGLRALTEKLGQPDKYHETITVFWIILIAERRQTRPADTFDDFCAQNPDLLSGARGLLLNHYSRGRLDSDLARTQFLLPDLPV